MRWFEMMAPSLSLAARLVNAELSQAGDAASLLCNTNAQSGRDVPRTGASSSRRAGARGVSCGPRALLSTGAVGCWGQNLSGRLGLGIDERIGDDETPASASVVDVGGRAVQIAAGTNTRACCSIRAPSPHRRRDRVRSRALLGPGSRRRARLRRHREHRRR